MLVARTWALPQPLLAPTNFSSFSPFSNAGGPDLSNLFASRSPEEVTRQQRARLDSMAKAPALPAGFELPLEPRLPRVGSVDAVALEERAATLATRSIKREAKLAGLELAVRMMDLTTLEGADTPGKVAALCSKAARPDPLDRGVPPVAAVCVYPNLLPVAKERLGGPRGEGGP